MIKTIQTSVANCICVANSTSGRVVYMIYPQVSGFSEDWLEKQVEKNNCSIVMVYVALDKWNDYLTPWPEPGETTKAQPFGGRASEFLRGFMTEIIPETDKVLGKEVVDERDLVGVSLAGLFTLWQWMQGDTFHSIACLSGSFWYDGFIEWFKRQPVPKKDGKAYFLLGTDEPKSKIKAFRPVGENTESIVSALRGDGVDVTFDWVPGNHFADALQRAEMALSNIR